MGAPEALQGASRDLQGPPGAPRDSSGTLWHLHGSPGTFRDLQAPSGIAWHLQASFVDPPGTLQGPPRDPMALSGIPGDPQKCANRVLRNSKRMLEASPVRVLCWDNLFRFGFDLLVFSGFVFSLFVTVGSGC